MTDLDLDALDALFTVATADPSENRRDWARDQLARAVPALTARVRELTEEAASASAHYERAQSDANEARAEAARLNLLMDEDNADGYGWRPRAERAEAEVARLRQLVEAANAEATSWCDAATLMDQRLQAVTALHQPGYRPEAGDDSPSCGACNTTYPCATALATGPESDGGKS